MLAQIHDRAFLISTWENPRSKTDIKNFVLEMNSTPLIPPHTKFDAISLKDVKGDSFQAKPPYFGPCSV